MTWSVNLFDIYVRVLHFTAGRPLIFQLIRSWGYIYLSAHYTMASGINGIVWNVRCLGEVFRQYKIFNALTPCHDLSLRDTCS